MMGDGGLRPVDSSCGQNFALECRSIVQCTVAVPFSPVAFPFYVGYSLCFSTCNT